MSVGIADLHRAIVAAWDTALLDAQFNAEWTTEEISRYPVLNDGEATPGQPFPYCVYELEEPDIVARMTGHSSAERHAIMDTPLTFKVYSKQIAGDSSTSKQRAALLAEEIMKTFGGHPTVPPIGPMVMDNGSHLITQIQTDHSERVGDEEYLHTVDYVVKTDVPVAV